jgi:uncharacterized membrane protein
MGFLTDLLLFPIMGPVRGVAFIAQQVQEAAEAGLLDEDQVQAELLSLSLRHATGEISEEEYAAAETELLGILDAMRIYRESIMEADGWEGEQ